MPLHTSHRPKKLKDLYGNEVIKESLQPILEREEDMPHSFLFTGPSGCGKTTLARILKNELGCSDMDYYTYNTSNTRGIDTIREINEKIHFSSMDGDVKVYMLEEAHQLTGASMEAMLDMIEEPPSHVYFILCTTEPEKLKKTLKRRCHQYEVQPLFRAEMKDLLNDVMKKEGQEISKNTFNKILSLSDGSAGIALNMLDKIIDMNDEEQAIETLESTTVNEAAVIDLCRELIKDRSWKKVKVILKNMKGDAESTRYAILGYFSAVMLNNGRQDIAEIMELFLDSYTECGKAGLILSCYTACRVK